MSLLQTCHSSKHLMSFLFTFPLKAEVKLICNAVVVDALEAKPCSQQDLQQWFVPRFFNFLSQSNSQACSVWCYKRRSGKICSVKTCSKHQTSHLAAKNQNLFGIRTSPEWKTGECVCVRGEVRTVLPEQASHQSLWTLLWVCFLHTHTHTHPRCVFIPCRDFTANECKSV